VVLEPGPDGAVHAAMAFLRQRGARRVVLAAEGAACTALLQSGAEAAAVVLVAPRAGVLDAAWPVAPALIVVPHELELLGRQLAVRLPQCRVAHAAPPAADLIRTFVLDALSSPARALEM
jgi:hypothetical protein